MQERERYVEWIREAQVAGARQAEACAALGICDRTLERWLSEGAVKADGRSTATRPAPSNKLSEEERQEILRVVNEPRFASLPPSQIVPCLADEGRYMGSEATFYRVLKEAGQQHFRGRAKPPERRAPASHCATGPNQLWCWDITYCASRVRGLYFYLYVVMDVYSRKIVGWEVHDAESGEHASVLIRKSMMMAGVAGNTTPLILHSDNGSPMKSGTLLATLQWLGVTPSYSRARVSNDNAYIESLFRTCKYRPEYPLEGFESLEKVREWMLKFVAWYNKQHRHSGLKFITPEERHAGLSEKVMEQRKRLYAQAKAKHPERWSGEIRNWSLPEQVWLNPPKAQAQMKAVA